MDDPKVDDEPMVTTNRLIPVDAIGNDPDELVHLTGLLQVLARVTMGDGDGLPVWVELFLDAARVRGLGLKSGARHQARGTCRFSSHPDELPISFDLVGTFELLGYRRGHPEANHRVLEVPFQVTVQADGRMMAWIGDPKLLPSPDG
jgi:hypothetical protein